MSSALPALTYFGGRGYAEAIRMTLCAARLEINEILLESREQYLKLSQDWIFGQCPCLEINGVRVVQTNAILRYLAKTYSFNGNSLEEETLIDQYFEGSRDFLRPFTNVGLPNSSEEKCIEEAKTKTLPKYMPIFEKLLAPSGGAHLVGSTLSLADIGLLEVLLSIDDYLGMETIEPYTNIKKFYQTLRSTEWVEHFMNTYRKGRKDDAYRQSVYKILGWA